MTFHHNVVCDDEECEGAPGLTGPWFQTWDFESPAETFGEALTSLTRAGWFFDIIDNKRVATCPACAQKKRDTPAPEGEKADEAMEDLGLEK